MASTPTMRPWAAALLATTACIALLSGAGSASSASAARVLHASDDAHLRYISVSGSTLYETGKAAGTLPGQMHVHMRIAATFSGSFLIYAQGGTIEGHGNATPHGSGVYESFAGTLIVSGGTGRYRHAHGRAGLYGTFNRNTYALVVKTTGNLYY